MTTETMTTGTVSVQMPAEHRPPSWRRVARAQLALVVAYRRRRRVIQLAPDEAVGAAWLGAAGLWLGIALAGLLAVALRHPRDG